MSNDYQASFTLVNLILDSYLATMVNGFHEDLIQPYALRTPEVILGKGWDTSADIWNLGCLVSKSSCNSTLLQYD